MNRRDLFGGIAALFVMPKNLLVNERAAGGYLAARRFSGGMVLKSTDCVPAMLEPGASFLPQQFVEKYNRLQNLKAINSRTPNLPPSEVFYKNNIETYTNSEDTSIVSKNNKMFGVSIYADPSGTFTNEI